MLILPQVDSQVVSIRSFDRRSGPMISHRSHPVLHCHLYILARNCSFSMRAPIVLDCLEAHDSTECMLAMLVGNRSCSPSSSLIPPVRRAVRVGLLMRIAGGVLLYRYFRAVQLDRETLHSLKSPAMQRIAKTSATLILSYVVYVSEGCT